MPVHDTATTALTAAEEAFPPGGMQVDGQTLPENHVQAGRPWPQDLCFETLPIMPGQSWL